MSNGVTQSNSLSMDSGGGLLIVTPSTGRGGSVVSGNTISGSSAHGIYINAHGAPNAGGVTLSSNTITGVSVLILIH